MLLKTCVEYQSTDERNTYKHLLLINKQVRIKYLKLRNV